MKLKILATGIILIMVSSTFVVSANIIQNDDIEDKTNLNNGMVEIRIARIGGGIERGKTTKTILNNYQWMVGNKTYKFITYDLYDEDVLKGKLTTKNYDLINMLSYVKKNMPMLSLPFLKSKIWKTNIANFVKGGGGIFGYCAGAGVIIGTEDKPKTLADILIDRTDLGISQVKRISEFNYSNPLFFSGISPFFYSRSDRLEETMGGMAYLWYGAKELNNESQVFGIPIDFEINRNNPIFDDFFGDTRRIYWGGGGALTIPDEYKDEVTILANYPADAISKNNSTQIHIWRYTGGFHGFISGFLEAIKQGYKFRDSPFIYSKKASDWEMTDKIIETNHASKTVMTMETYPNEKQGRIILSYCHPEICGWWGGHIEDVPDTDKNNLFDGLYTWKDVTPFNQTVEDEMTYNWWIVRRHAAWVGKVPDNDLPPVYGPSQVSDIYPYNQSSSFTITGNAETTSIESEWLYHKESLDLYYRHSSDDNSWSDWTLYQTDNDNSDGWSWNFDASLADGPGYYQFYSLRNVQYENEWLNETAPPGPDAMIRVV